MERPDIDTGLSCPRCGYNMTGLTTSRCPECGCPFTLTDPALMGESPPVSMGGAFVRGGLYGLIGFVVLGLACALVGGRFHIDLCGAAMLFVIGGLIGLGIRAIYGRGYRQGSRQHDRPL